MSTLLSSKSRLPTYDPNLVEVKAKFECEFRRFSVDRHQSAQFADFYALVRDSYHLPPDMPFTISYTDPRNQDLLPITNNDNLGHAFSIALPLLRLLIYRKQDDMLVEMRQREKKGKRPPRTTIPISAPLEDFRVVSSIVDADLLPDTVRRVKLLKHSTDRPLGFYIRDGTSVRVTPYGLEKVPGIFISRLVPGGLAEGTGLLAVNDEILEVNAIEVIGKSLDQVTDMMVVNSQNLIITVKPASQPPSTPRTQPIAAIKPGQKPGAITIAATPTLTKAASVPAPSIAMPTPVPISTRSSSTVSSNGPTPGLHDSSSHGDNSS